MGAVLPPLIHNHTPVQLPISLIQLHHALVVVQTEDVHCARDLELGRQVEEKIETQMLQWSRLLTRVRILVVLPADSNERLGEGEAPEDLRLPIVLSKHAVILASVRGYERTFMAQQSLLVRVNELLPGICDFRLR